MPPYTREELLRVAGVTARNLRYWIACGIVPSPGLHGMHSRYGEEYVVLLRVIRRLRTREKLRIEAIRARLAGLSPAQLRALDPASPPVPAPVPVPVPVPAPAPAPFSSPSLPPAARWDHFELLPGLELHLRADAGPLLRRLAAEIHTHYAGAALSPEPAAASE